MHTRKILVTGAAGGIGGYLGRHWQDKYDLRLTDRRPLDYDISGCTEFIQAGISNLDEMRALCDGVDTVVHLAADPSPKADFYESLLNNNIMGLFNGFQAAADQGCRRVVYASSVNAVVGHPEGYEVTEKSLIHPINHYGACKVLGEALAWSFFHKHEITTVCIRFGRVRVKVPEVKDPDDHVDWISGRDIGNLIERSIEIEGIDVAIAHGFSRHRNCRYSIAQTCAQLGYTPLDGTAMLNR
jgi:NAD+ dependent glucose-6-phosphate dehydrogenase